MSLNKHKSPNTTLEVIVDVVLEVLEVLLEALLEVLQVPLLDPKLPFQVLLSEKIPPPRGGRIR